MQRLLDITVAGCRWNMQCKNDSSKNLTQMSTVLHHYFSILKWTSWQVLCWYLPHCDKHQIKVSEPGSPVAAVEQRCQVIVPPTGGEFVVGDHQFSIIPSVVLIVDILNAFEGSWYQGKVKEVVFQASSPIRHATELHSLSLLRKDNKTILFMHSDGSTDHEL